jgi:hypothetical protein
LVDPFGTRLRATSGRVWELHKLLQELRTGNYAAERLKRARDVRNLSALLPRRLEKHTERVLAIWQQMADIENAEIATLLPRLKRRANSACPTTAALQWTT